MESDTCFKKLWTTVILYVKNCECRFKFLHVIEDLMGDSFYETRCKYCVVGDHGTQEK